MGDLEERLAFHLGEVKTLRAAIKKRRVEASAAEEPTGQRKADLVRKARIATIPAMEKRAAELRAQLRAQLMFEQALPGPGEPVRQQPPADISHDERIRFMQKALGRYKTALAKWLQAELLRLEKHVDELITFD